MALPREVKEEEEGEELRKRQRSKIDGGEGEEGGKEKGGRERRGFTKEDQTEKFEVMGGLL